MDVDIKTGKPQTEAGEPGLLPRLEQRDPRQVGLPISMASRLQPATQLDVEEQQHAGAGLIHDQRRAREMARSDGAVGKVRLLVERRKELLPCPFHHGIARGHGSNDRGGNLWIRRARQGG